MLQLFPGNVIPTSRIDPVAAAIMAQLPKPNIGNDLYVNNFAESGDFYKLQQIPSIKVDQNFGTNFKISGFYEGESTTKSNGVDGLPAILSQVRIQAIRSKLARFNADYTISPTLLFHFGGGFHLEGDTLFGVVACDYGVVGFHVALEEALAQGRLKLSLDCPAERPSVQGVARRRQTGLTGRSRRARSCSGAAT